VIEEPSEPKVEDTIPFSHSVFDQELSEVGRYFSELIYVDRTLAYLDTCDDPRMWAEPPLLLYEQYDIRVGETFPFTRSIRMLDPRFDDGRSVGR
jgi:hypothetical protein